ncbi:MAG: hypothetical protein EOP06_02195 [Proteobacteria bacterium]|nr:MAG: hypothetical protein EOP06_02195 [Pseudomonadota bacterium]
MSKDKDSKTIRSATAAEYFSKNLQQVGFSSPQKAVLTTIKEAVDNGLDACEDHGILPDIMVRIERLGVGVGKGVERLKITVTDNGPGIKRADIPKVFGEYLASSKFGRGRASRGQQGIGISAATSWALQTTATPVEVITKLPKDKKATKVLVEVDLRNNKGIEREISESDWDVVSGTSVSFVMEGKLVLNGDTGVVSYLTSTALVNPHLNLTYFLPGEPKGFIARVSDVLTKAPEAVPPHPHTMRLGEFLHHAQISDPKLTVKAWLKDGFSRC